MVITKDKPVLNTSTRSHGNVFLILKEASEILINEGLRDESIEMTKRVSRSISYREALSIISQYVEVR